MPTFIIKQKKKLIVDLLIRASGGVLSPIYIYIYMQPPEDISYCTTINIYKQSYLPRITEYNSIV